MTLYVRLFSAFAAVAGIAGCYDLSFDDEDHVVSDFAVMAVHLEPPELRPDTPIEAEILYADPNGKGRDVWHVWNVQMVDLDNGNYRGILARIGRDKKRIEVPSIPIGEPELGERDLLYVFNIVLCAGQWNTGKTFTFDAYLQANDDFCLDGPVLFATKTIGFADPLYPQNNPTINRLLLNDDPVLPMDAGGEGRVVCTNDSDCSAWQDISLYITQESVESYAIKTETFFASADDEPGRSEAEPSEEEGEAPASSSSIETELIIVDWYVSGGSLARLISYPDIPGVSVGPYRTRWRPGGEGAYTLWAIVRDVRGGNSYHNYRIVVERSSE